MKVKSKNYLYFTDFFAKIKPLLTHIRKTPPLRSHYDIDACMFFEVLFLAKPDQGGIVMIPRSPPVEWNQLRRTTTK